MNAKITGIIGFLIGATASTIIMRCDSLRYQYVTQDMPGQYSIANRELKRDRMTGKTWVRQQMDPYSVWKLVQEYKPDEGAR